MIREETYENSTVIMEQQPKFSRLIESAIVAVIETEPVLLTEELDKYRDYVVHHMLAFKPSWLLHQHPSIVYMLVAFLYWDKCFS